MSTETSLNTVASKRLQNKIALITGAGSGIGAATAHLFAKEGAKLLITGDKEEPLKQVADQIQLNNGIAEFLVLDISNEDNWKNALNKIIQVYGKIDILVNNAGISGNLSLPLEQRTTTEFMNILSVNLLGTFLGVKTAASYMTAGGSIVNLSSIAGITGNAGGNAYTASKGGSRMFTKGAAVDLAKRGIRVNSVHPGYVETPMTQNVEGAREFKEMAVGNTPLGRGAEPIEIAQGILFLASDEASFVTGAELVIDGGFTAF